MYVGCNRPTFKTRCAINAMFCILVCWLQLQCFAFLCIGCNCNVLHFCVLVAIAMYLGNRKKKNTNSANGFEEGDTPMPEPGPYRDVQPAQDKVDEEFQQLEAERAKLEEEDGYKQMLHMAAPETFEDSDDSESFGRRERVNSAAARRAEARVEIPDVAAILEKQGKRNEEEANGGGLDDDDDADESTTYVENSDEFLIERVRSELEEVVDVDGEICFSRSIANVANFFFCLDIAKR